MQKLIIGIFFSLAASIPAFAETLSEFERGFERGRRSCGTPPTTAVMCTAPRLVFTHSFIDEKTTLGRTKAEAMLKQDARHLQHLIEAGKTVDCLSLAP